MKSSEFITEEAGQQYAIVVETDPSSNAFHDISLLNWGSFSSSPDGHDMDVFDAFVQLVLENDAFEDVGTFLGKHLKAIKLTDHTKQAYTEGMNAVAFGQLSSGNLSKVEGACQKFIGIDPQADQERRGEEFFGKDQWSKERNH